MHACCNVEFPFDKHHTLSESAMKNMLSSVVDTSKACGLFRMSSAPFMDRHRFTCAPHDCQLMPHACTCGSAVTAAESACQQSNGAGPARLNDAAWDGVLQWQQASAVRVMRQAPGIFGAQVSGSCTSHSQGRKGTGEVTGVTMSDLNQKILPCLRTNHLCTSTGML